MRFARLVSTYNRHHPDFDQLVETADLDVLQLDYLWPHLRPPGASYAPGLMDQLPLLNKSLYLDPKFHLITNAGSRNPRMCAEALAEAFCERGNAELPLTVIRGDNVLPCLEELKAAGIELKDQKRGTPLDELTQPLLSAQVDLGAGPLVTAWEEGSRAVVAGGYDSAAPAIATAVSSLGLPWEQVDLFSHIAIATHLPQVLIELDSPSELTIKAYHGQSLDPAKLVRQLSESSSQGHFWHADVDCQLDKLELHPQETGSFRLAGIRSQASRQEWLLRITYQAGFVAEVLLTCSDAATVQKTADQLRGLLQVQHSEQRAIEIDSLHSTGEAELGLIRLHCESQQQQPCVDLIDEVTQAILQAELPGCELHTTPPSCQIKTSQIDCPVPREAIDVSVDTRPAKEWR